ncbi:uncharacterized protein AB675_4710 [Cyphellophora attinorum]|uniref:Centromere protein S n=1 Tax=Cyphellophora attinorum TaxID=1664694 RepID=A0A0N0NL97_9EURO|nr:uncharacterized protein AB675_4710 [Phialophora attinorum]KPI38928.1 hypothetical protein AB675_4710 [Phialophora attinorum]
MFMVYEIEASEICGERVFQFEDALCQPARLYFHHPNHQYTARFHFIRCYSELQDRLFLFGKLLEVPFCSVFLTSNSLHSITAPTITTTPAHDYCPIDPSIYQEDTIRIIALSATAHNRRTAPSTAPHPIHPFTTPTTNTPTRHQPPTMPDSSTTTESALKSALWLHTAHLVDSLTLDMGINATPQFKASLMELTYAQIVSAGGDIEAFAKHAGRKVVKVEDVVMLGRRNEGLKEVLEGEVRELRATK